LQTEAHRQRARAELERRRRQRERLASAEAEAAKSTEAPRELGLLDFVPTLARNFTRPTHLAPIAEAFEQSWTRSVRYTAHAPPRHGKTDLILAFIALTLKRFPWKTLAYVSYETKFAQTKSRKARMWAVAAGVQLARDANALTEWRTTDGGGLIAGGIGGPLTGKGVDILFVDDPYKNRQQAESAAYRHMVADWWDDVADTRIEPGGSFYISHTRWTIDDLIAHVRDGEKAAFWQPHICLPAVNDRDEALWPERWPIDLLRSKMANTHTWASLYQGDPRPRGGRVFNGTHYYDRRPDGAFEIAIGVDLAYTATKQADWSVAVVLARYYEVVADQLVARYYVVEVLRRQCAVTEWKRALGELSNRYPGAPIFSMVGGQEKAIAELIAQTTLCDDGSEIPGVFLDTAPSTTDKFVAAQDVAGEWNLGRVLLPSEGGPWVKPFVKSVTSFTGTPGEQDDDPDALRNAFKALGSTVPYESFSAPRR
jgi:predicted phage terminase large subunit-like protein